jgi:hypothetical protein
LQPASINRELSLLLRAYKLGYERKPQMAEKLPPIKKLAENNVSKGEGVLKPDIYDPTLNPVYADMLRHCGVVALPCRVADPDRKDHASYRTSSQARSRFPVRAGLSLM